MSGADTGEKVGEMGRKRGRLAAGFTVRRFRDGDAAAICGVMGESPEAAQWSMESVQGLNCSPGGLTLVIEAEGEVSGFLMARHTADEAEILNCAIRKEYRRGGYATALLAAAFESFRARAVGRVFLEVRESNRAAIELYERHGFREAQRRKGYYREPEEAAVRMERKVTG